METLKLLLSPRSSFKSKLQSDTIFGQFCWYYRYKYGEEKLITFLTNYNTTPSIIFSDGFYNGYLPLPILKPLAAQDFENSAKKFTSDSNQIYQLAKYFKKIEYIKEDDLLRLLDLDSPLSNSDILEKLLQSRFNKNSGILEDVVHSMKTHILKNSVNRLLNTTTEGLHQSEETFFDKGVKIDIYVRFSSDYISQQEIVELFEIIGKVGFGADKSVGKGRFKIESFTTEFGLKKFTSPSKSKNGFVSLSSGLALDSKIELNYGKTFTKFGKAGGHNAIGPNPFKNPLILFKSGSTFFKKEESDFYGASTNEPFYDKKGYHSGYMIPIFLNLEKED